jgi:hypothetical protein
MNKAARNYVTRQSREEQEWLRASVTDGKMGNRELNPEMVKTSCTMPLRPQKRISLPVPLSLRARIKIVRNTHC